MLITKILTTVAFKLLIASTTPKAPYATTLACAPKLNLFSRLLCGDNNRRKLARGLTRVHWRPIRMVYMYCVHVVLRIQRALLRQCSVLPTRVVESRGRNFFKFYSRAFRGCFLFR